MDIEKAKKLLELLKLKRRKGFEVSRENLYEFHHFKKAILYTKIMLLFMDIIQK